MKNLTLLRFTHFHNQNPNHNQEKLLQQHSRRRESDGSGISRKQSRRKKCIIWMKSTFYAFWKHKVFGKRIISHIFFHNPLLLIVFVLNRIHGYASSNPYHIGRSLTFIHSFIDDSFSLELEWKSILFQKDITFIIL